MTSPAPAGRPFALPFAEPIALARSRLDERVVASLRRIVGSRWVSTEDADRLAYSRDCWPLLLIEETRGCIRYPPDGVVWPGSAQEVSDVLRLAGEEGLPVVPFGGGSGVCGGAVAKSGGIILDLKRLDRITSVDDTSLLVDAEAGINGWHLEEGLRARGLTLGHFPSSILCSTLGGWIAARSAGQLSTKYGVIEDMVRGLDVCLADGTMASVRAQPRRAAGPDLLSLFIGSEGTLGVVTRATLRVHPAPEGRVFRALSLPDFPSGMDVIRRTLRAGIRPAAVRLYDPLDTLIAAPKSKRAGRGLKARLKALLPALKDRIQPILLRHPGVANALVDLAPTRSLLVLVFEGDWAQAKLDDQRAAAIAREAGAEDLGVAPARAWWDERYHISFKQPGVFLEGSFVDTMEVAARWRDLPAVYEAVRGAIRPDAIVLAHVSHAYTEGANIYFTFSAPLPATHRVEDATEPYLRIWKNGLTACAKAGGSTSHHHGVGVQKAAFIEAEWGGLYPVLRAVKRALDPRGILNPGALGLGGPDLSTRAGGSAGGVAAKGGTRHG